MTTPNGPSPCQASWSPAPHRGLTDGGCPEGPLRGGLHTLRSHSVKGRARRYQGWLDDGTHATLASLGRAERISGTRVGQLLALLHLAPEIVAVLERPKEELPSGLSGKAVRAITHIRGEKAQRAAFEARWPGVLGPAAAAK